MELILYFALALPLMGFLALTLLSESLPRIAAGALASATVLLSFLCFLFFLYWDISFDLGVFGPTLYSWIPFPGINASLTFYLDSVSLLMSLIITGVGGLIHVYSIGYMEDDRDWSRYFAFMNLFVFSMLLLVLSGNLLWLFVGWEGVGLASYLLIGFWYQRPAAAKAANKAFIVNRIGDFGFLLGIIGTFVYFGTGDVAQILQRAGDMPFDSMVATGLTLLFFMGAIGKSAQFPLHTWLPDAMEGPTPVSALIHAATMVTAGVYLVVRLHPLFLQAPVTMHIMGTVGGLTSFFAALAASGQSDLKRVLAYSTVSQLGLMFLACGAGAFFSAMFHLTTHAFVKALLFLSAGNVIHRLHGETQMEEMGGLNKVLPYTSGLFLLGVIAMSGVPPLAIFFSKEWILAQEYHSGFYLLYFLGLSTTFLTSFYLLRAYLLTFFGDLKASWNHVKEVSSVMLIPLAILGGLTFFGGILGITYGHLPLLGHFIDEAGVSHAEALLGRGFILSWESAAAVGSALLGLSCAAWLFMRQPRKEYSMEILQKGFYCDQVYSALLVRPLKAISFYFHQTVEPKFFENMMAKVASFSDRLAKTLQLMESGQIRSYAAWIAFGCGALLIYLGV